MSNQNKLDLIIWGATGFTGQLVCEYINKTYSSSNLRWGIAGRNKEKVLSVAKRLNIDEERDCKIVRRKGRLYVINKKNPRFKQRQG